MDTLYSEQVKCKRFFFSFQSGLILSKCQFDDTKLLSLSKYAKFVDFLRLKDFWNCVAHKRWGKNASLLGNSFVSATTALVEQSSSALKRLKRYSQSRTNQAQLYFLSMTLLKLQKTWICLTLQVKVFFFCLIGFFFYSVCFCVFISAKKDMRF